MKKTTLFLLLFVSILLLNSCKKNYDLVNVVPKNAVVVAMYDGSKCPKGFSFEKEFLPEDIQKELSELKINFPNINNIFEKFFKDPNSLGIKVDAKNYAFISLDGTNTDIQNIGFCFPIDRKIFEDNINLVFDDFKMDPVAFLKKSGNYTFTQPDNSIIVAWNDKMLVVLAGDNVNINSIEKLVNQKKSESILSNDDFMNFYENCKTANLWISSNIVSTFEPEYVQKIYDLMGFDLNNNYGHIIIDITKKEIDITTKLRVNKTFQEPDMEKIKNNRQEINKEFFNPCRNIIERLINKYFGLGSSRDYSEAEIEQMLQEMEDEVDY